MDAITALEKIDALQADVENQKKALVNDIDAVKTIRAARFVFEELGIEETLYKPGCRLWATLCLLAAFGFSKDEIFELLKAGVLG